MPDRLDDAVATVIGRHADRGFYIADLSRETMRELGAIPRMRRLDLAELIRQEAHRRIREALTRTDANGLRLYENYHDGRGPRWQRLGAMRARELAVTIGYRERQVQGHLQVIAQYRAILAVLERLGAEATVDQAVDDMGQATG